MLSHKTRALQDHSAASYQWQPDESIMICGNQYLKRLNSEFDTRVHNWVRQPVNTRKLN